MNNTLRATLTVKDIEHTAELVSDPSAFERRNAIAPAVGIRCSCGFTSRALFEDTARRVISDHLASVRGGDFIDHE